MSLLSVKGLSFSYPQEHTAAVRAVSFNVASGEHIALIGPNGSGKTTLFNLMAGFLNPGAGEILLDGQNIRSYPIRERARRIALVQQGGRISFPYTCLETVLMGLHPHEGRFSYPDDRSLARAEQVMRETGVWEFAGKNVTELSGGQLQRVMLARAIIQILPTHDAAGIPPGRILLLDEALSELDIAARIMMMKILGVLALEHRITIIGIHHDLSLVYQFTGRVIALSAGSIAADGAPQHVFTEDFFAGVFSVQAEIAPGKGFFFYDEKIQEGKSVPKFG
jgi:iron complex transport system ATP-binding protein